MRKQAFAGTFGILVKQIHLFIRIAFSKYGNVNAVFLVSVPEQIPVRSDVGHASLMNQYIMPAEKKKPRRACSFHKNADNTRESEGYYD